jgi:ribose 5-phosphate isomerase B
MKIYIASDHAGYELKNTLKAFMTELGHTVEDKGAFALNTSDDYPDFITPAARAVATDAGSMGIVLGASGQGEAMCANKIEGIRCAVYYGDTGTQQTDASGNILNMIASTRSHNDANILSLGARFITEEEAKHVVKTFLETPFSNEERHIRRINKF